MPHSKGHSKTPLDATEKKETSKTLGYIKAHEEQKREDDLNLITAVEKQVQGVLSEVQYIAELLETNKKILDFSVIIHVVCVQLFFVMKFISAFIYRHKSEQQKKF